jgi:hypothetical protein
MSAAVTARRSNMQPAEFGILSSNGTFHVAMVALVGLFMGLWYTTIGKGH